MIGETRPIKAIRNVVLALTLTLIGATSMADPSVAQAQAISPITTGVMVILTVKAGVTRDQVMAVMAAEVRQTVQLYLNGKVREWYSRADGRGAVFLLDAKDVAEAHVVMEGLPLAKQNLMGHEYIAVGPLMPLRLLMANP
jgi:muconolactone delta-isomerase